MKKRMISMILAAGMITTTFSGCGLFSKSEGTQAADAAFPGAGDAVKAEAEYEAYSGDDATASETNDAPVYEYYDEPASEAAPAYDMSESAGCEAFDGTNSYKAMPEAITGSAKGLGTHSKSAGFRAANDGFPSQGCVEDSDFYEEEYYYEDDLNTEEYKYIPENVWMSPVSSPFSTFSADVDTASYANVRRMILNNQDIPADAVRIEEMINYFSYDYKAPSGNDPFGVTTQIAPCPWNKDNHLLLVGLKAKDMDMRERTNSNLVFLVDVSGSMADSDKLPLIQRSFRLLCEELGDNDRISIVTYASGDTVVLDGVRGGEKARINDAMEDLFAGGSTNGSAGINTAYEIAQRNFIKGGNNRIILATDGDLNVGATDEGSLTRLVQEKAKSGIYLSVLGFGQGNISDVNMEALADNGNGNYNYIDSVNEARRVLIDEIGGTLFTVAKDVKLQVEFNPEYIKGYRLIGYENRQMAAESFADDTKDGGEIGAGHCVTALYEIAGYASSQPVEKVESKYTDKSAKSEPLDMAKGELLTVNIRYKDPDGSTSRLMEYPVDKTMVSKYMSDDMSWAAGVAQIGMILRGSQYAGDSSLRDVLYRMEGTKYADSDEYRREFLYLYGRI